MRTTGGGASAVGRWRKLGRNRRNGDGASLGEQPYAELRLALAPGVGRGLRDLRLLQRTGRVAVYFGADASVDCLVPLTEVMNSVKEIGSCRNKG